MTSVRTRALEWFVTEAQRGVTDFQTLMDALFVTHDLSDPKRVDFGFMQGRALDLTQALPSEGPCGWYEPLGGGLAAVQAWDNGLLTSSHSRVIKVEPLFDDNEHFARWFLDALAPITEQPDLGPNVQRFTIGDKTIVARGRIGVQVKYRGKVSWLAYLDRFSIEAPFRT